MNYKQKDRLLWACVALGLAVFLAFVGFTLCEITYVLGFFALWMLIMSLVGNIPDHKVEKLPKLLFYTFVAFAYAIPPLLALLIVDLAHSYFCPVEFP